MARLSWSLLLASFGGLLLSPMIDIRFGILLICLPVCVILKLAHDKKNIAKDLWKGRLKLKELHDDKVCLSVIVPAYNEEKRLPKMLDEALDFLEDRVKTFPTSKDQNLRIYEDNGEGFSYEIIIVDDGSQDGTTECGVKYRQRLGPSKVRVLALEENLGKGGAVREGVLAARGDYIIFADADGASKFADIAKLEKFIFQSQPAKKLMVAIGSRAHMEEHAIANRSLFRTILMKGFHQLVRTCCVSSIRDTQCGFKMFNRDAAELLFTNYHNESWAFDVELLYLAERTGCTIGEIPITWEEIDGSKIVPVFSWIRMGLDVLCLGALYSLGIYQVPHEQPSQLRVKKH